MITPPARMTLEAGVSLALFTECAPSADHAGVPLVLEHPRPDPECQSAEHFDPQTDLLVGDVGAQEPEGQQGGHDAEREVHLLPTEADDSLRQVHARET